MKRLVALIGAWLIGVSASPPPVALDLILGDTLPPKLSDYRFFRHAIGEIDVFTPQRHANADVRYYDVNTELYSDRLVKRRFLYLPPGKRPAFAGDGVLDFPLGSVLIKNFGYIANPGHHVPRIKMVETRLLMRRVSGWVPLPYVWNADGSDAVLARAGKRIQLSIPTFVRGKPREISYAVPNVNQCKGCHDAKGALTPIGPKPRNLGVDLRNGWKVSGLPEKLPPPMPDALRSDGYGVTLESRARAYLDVNCGHCHNRDGPANTSGLWLDWNQPRDVNYGIGKRPTAAGRGAGDFDFAIAPGHPEASILIYRMQSLDPGVAMPELGRATVHEEGVELLSEWIRTLK